MRRARIVALGVAATFLCHSAQAKPEYQTDRGLTRVTALSGLFDASGCARAQLTGKVVSRKFDARGTRLQSLTVSEKSGERSLINVDLSLLDALSMVEIRWIVTGLQTLSKEGRAVVAKVALCGAAGRVMYLEGLQ